MKTLLSSLGLTALLAAPALAQGIDAPLNIDIGIRVSSLLDMNASDSYDAVFDGDAITSPGVQIELTSRGNYLLALAYERGEVDGRRVLPGNPPIRTELRETLTLAPLHVTIGWVFAPLSQWHGFVGAGPTLLDWKDESGAESASGSDWGYHGAAGLRWRTVARRLTVGAEVRHSRIPDAVGEAGVTALFDEDDLGGTSVGLHVLWRVR